MIDDNDEFSLPSKKVDISISKVSSVRQSIRVAPPTFDLEMHKT